MPGVGTETTVHRTAEIDPAAVLGAGVTVGPGAVVGPGCVIGDGCRIGPRAVIVRRTTLGASCAVHAGAVLGDDPQDRAYREDDPGSLEIGSRVIVREFVTLHRGAGKAGPTVIGDGCYLMACSHVGHNCRVGAGVVLTNYAGLAGHVRVGDGCVFSGHAAAHQFCDIGEGCMFQAGARVSQHVPPFCIVHRDGNRTAGINAVGLRRAGVSRASIDEVRRVYSLLFRSGRLLPAALKDAASRGWGPEATRMIEFCQRALALEPPRARGVCRAIADPRG